MAGLAALSAALRVPGVGSQPLWTDEANCLAIAQARTMSVWRALEHDCSPPLYYWLLGIVVGDEPGEARVRALSLFFGILAPPVLAFAGTRLLGPAGAVAGLLLALSPLHLWHSQEARMYSMVCLLGVVLAWGTAATRRDARWPWMLAACQIALLWTHHFSSFAVAVSWCILAARGVSMRRVGLLAGAVILGWAPAAYLLARQAFVFKTGTWLGPPTLDAPLRSIGLWLAGVQGASHSRVAGIPMALVLAGLGALPLGVAGLGCAVGRVMAALTGGTLTLAWIASRVVPAMVPGRYDVVVMPAFLVLLAAGWSRSKRIERMLALVALLAGSLLGVRHYVGAYEKGSIRDLVRVVASAERPGDVLVVVPEIEAPVVHYYYRGRLSVLVPPSFGLVDRVDYAHYGRRWESEKEARLLADRCWAAVRPGGRIFLLYSPYRATEHFKGRLMHEAVYTRISRRVSGSGSVELALLARREPAADKVDGGGT